ncbi:MAG: acyl-CoA thioesterase [Cyanobacteria bacterium RM1_2_2]|nr:acyl-CoA thioesterase [Cyanobacteria bacterium RM1_2_2]
MTLPFTYLRTVRFQDTDAAGVVYFANVLSMCHESYEASLAAGGIDLKTFFCGEVALPIIHAEIDYRQPMFCGESYLISVAPVLLSPDKFENRYQISAAPVSELGSELDPEANSSVVAQAVTLHLCIDAKTRKRRALPSQVRHWLEHFPSNLDISAQSSSVG